MSLQCCACTAVKKLSEFSKSQLQKKDSPRCVICVENIRATVLSSPSGGSYRRCMTCKVRLALDKFRGEERQCRSCHSVKENSRKEKENETKRNQESGACKVKDVQRIYGHLCEIPIQAYREAGVAFSRNDYVTSDDVERASAAWDARSIAHDIDTDWGSMPGGGAYSDRNHYYGPGEYDYY